MKEINSEIEINASLSRVWGILADIKNWNKWNPIVNDADGRLTLGSKLTVTMKGKDGKDTNKYSPEVIQLDMEKSFRWKATMMAGFLFTNYKQIELKETSSGTQLKHSEQFSGLLVPLFWSKMEAGVPKMIGAMNRALKGEAEK